MKRRHVLQTLAVASAAPLLSQKASKAYPPNTAVTPASAFAPHQFATLCQLCDRVIPADEASGGAIEAKVPELIELLARENQDYRTRFAGGITWLDSQCHDRFNSDYLSCTAEQQTLMLDMIAYREKAEAEPALSQGIAFFSFLRDLTLGGYFTSEIGIKYLPYLGNKALSGFPGCPPIPHD